MSSIIYKIGDKVKCKCCDMIGLIIGIESGGVQIEMNNFRKEYINNHNIQLLESISYKDKGNYISINAKNMPEES